MNTEQQVINAFYGDDNTKSSSDLIGDLKATQNGLFTTEEVKTQIKLDFPNVTDWSF